MPTLRAKNNTNVSADVDDDKIPGRVRTSQRVSSKVVYTDNRLRNADDNVSEEVISSTENDDSEDDADESEVEVVEGNSARNSRVPVGSGRAGKRSDDTSKENRRSARSTKFSSSMTEPSASMKEFLVSQEKEKATKQKTSKKSDEVDLVDSDDNESNERVSSQSRKQISNPKKTLKGNLKSKRAVLDESSDEEDDDKSPLKIQRILASRTETIGKWREVCKRMCTSEIHFGSRWYQEEKFDNKNDIANENDIANHREKNDDVFEERFLVKWWDLSYLHCSWEKQADIVDQIEGGKGALNTFFRKNNNGVLYSADERMDGDYFDPGYTQIERILEIDAPREYEPISSPDEEDQNDESSFGMICDKKNPAFDDGVGRMILIKWTNLSFSECTHEYERDLIINDVEYKSHAKLFWIRSTKPSKLQTKKNLLEGDVEVKRLYKIFGEKNQSGQREAAIEAYKQTLQERTYKNGGQLRDYQAEGVAWMISNYLNDRSSILCDEMGLGKTLQTAATCDIIIRQMRRQAPILIIAPLSTLAHWYREFMRWTDLNAVVYHGLADDRREIRKHEFVYEADRPKSEGGVNSLYLKRCIPKRPTKLDNPWMVDVVITTPEMMITDDTNELAVIDWSALIIDEAHRMKNHNSKLGVTLRHEKFSFDHKILLTGTPIQNDVQEFWTILNFIDNERFGDKEAFLEKYGEMKSKEVVDKLHDEIRPYILRRLKEDVEKSVPPKEETLIEVELTIAQKQYYRALYEKNLKFLHKNKSKALDGPSLNNLAMQLRKVCNHLFLLNGIEEEFRRPRKGKVSEGDLLVEGSGKLVLLDKLLPRLKQEGHRVLIFSQFKIMLDILEDYLNCRSFKFERIDGSITGKKRQQAIDRFQAPDTDVKDPPFVMMLTTRAGGVGINLTAADTCIIFDSDWNPQNDLQAQARCHRIGQTKSVKIYRLISRKSYEMQMFHMSSLKMGLDQAVLNGVEGGSSEATLSKDEVEKLLRHGAYDIFNEDKTGNAEAESDNFVQLDIDSILERSKIMVHENTGSSSNAAGGTFSKASFKVSANGADAASEDIDIEDPDFWKKMIGEPKAGEDVDVFLNNKRQRKVVSYSESDINKQLLGEVLSDTDSNHSDDEYENIGVTEERVKWGGDGQTEWSKDDAESVIRILHTFGYGREVDVFSLKKKYEPTEVNRMCWSVIFAVIRQTVDDEYEILVKKEQLAVDRANAVSTETSQGGLLSIPASASSIVGPVGVDPKGAKEKILVSLLRSLTGWIQIAVDDATNFAKTNEPRKEEVLNKLRTASVPTDATSMFATNLWPSLKSRGWKANLITEGDRTGETRYSFKDKEFSSSATVLLAAKALHPELSKIVDAIAQQTSETLKQSTEAELMERNRELNLSIQNLSYESIDKFFNRYAPLQLVCDRQKARRLRLSRKILSTCNMLFSARKLIERVESIDDFRKKTEELAASMSIDKRSFIPHPRWKNQQDAVLVQSIWKHGWIDHDLSCRAILTDESIKWGPPFDSLNVPKTVNVSLAPGEDQLIRAVADRAACFLNNCHPILSEMKDFNEHLLIRAYGLDKGTDRGSDWVPNPDSVLKSFSIQQAIPVDCQEAVELPSKKDLVKRAKIILQTQSVLHCDARKSTTPTTYGVGGFVVIDQSRITNLLLVELIRSVLKESAGSKVVDRLIVFAIAEARIRLEEVTMYSEKNTKETAGKVLADHQKLVGHLELVQINLGKSARQYKNVLRVILGGEPLRSNKNPDDVLFPKERVNHSSVVANRNEFKDLLSTATEKSIEISRRRILERYGTREGMASIDKGSDGLDLTEIETLIISAVSNLGLPIWSADWEVLMSTNSGDPTANSWSMVGLFLTDVARQQFSRATDQLSRTTIDLDHVQRITVASHENLPKLKVVAVSNQEKAQALFRSKQEVLRQADDYFSNLDHLAKKCILLLAKINMNKSLADFSQSKVGLGEDVLLWLNDEICKWANSLDLLAEDGEPLAFTAIDFLDDLSDKERVTIELYSSFDTYACRMVFEQAALVTRLRSVQQTFERSRVGSIIEMASHRLKGESEVWTRPYAWDLSCDKVMLHRLATFGFTDRLMISNANSGEGGPLTRIPFNEKSYFVPKGLIQTRANQLIRAIHVVLSDTELTEGVKRPNIEDVEDCMEITKSPEKKQKLSPAAQ